MRKFQNRPTSRAQAFQSRLAQFRLKISSVQAERGKALLFRFFQRAEKCLNGQPSRFPLEKLMRFLSPFYERAWKITEEFEIPVVASLRSATRSVDDWHPFMNSIQIPPIEKELQWLSTHRLSDRLRMETNALLNFNTNLFHDGLHSVFFRLVPGPSGNLKDYFLFVEALVCTSELYAALELGPLTADSLVSFRSLTRSLKNEPALQAHLQNQKKLFFVGFANLLVRLHQWPQARLKELPSHAPFVESPALTSPGKVIHSSVPRWIRRFQNETYPEDWRKLSTSRPKLHMDAFSVETILKLENLEKIWEWYHKVFWSK